MTWDGQKLMVEILKVVRYLTAAGAQPRIFSSNLQENR